MQCFAPHLVHLVTPFSIGLAGLRWALQNDIPILASFHTNFVEYLAYYHASFLGGPVWRFFRWFHDHADLNLAPSQSTKQKLAENGISPVRLWGRGVNTREFSPAHRDWELREQLGAEGKTLLLYVGRLAPEKDLDILWQALRRLNQGEYPVHLVVTGKGPLENQLRDTAPDNVTFTGYLQGEDLHRVYASCDIFAFPSTTETYGNVVLEAHASGLPVVAPLSGGIRENLVDGVNGLACTPRDAEEMAARLTTLLARPRLRKRLGANGRKHALGKSWDNIMAGLVNDYCAVAFGDSQQDREVDYTDDAGEVAVGSGRD
jgi:glycosyltransferase involved in cell wall biosynthesis